jgi:alkylation response protein AidB-like acyl-CoA dehydrogenase
MDYLELDLNLTEEDIALKRAAHKFAREVMRPIAKQLDEMTPEQVIAKDSSLWDFMKKAYELGYHTVLIPESYGGMNLTSLQQMIIFEELCWGSAGLATLIAVAAFPAFVASMVPEDEIIEKIIAPFCECRDGSIIGCWAITEPDHGSDTLIPGYPSFSDPAIRANCRVTLDEDEWVINGQKSSWVSGGTIATHCALYAQVDPSMGHAGSGIFVVPLDLRGVSRGKPLNKMGQRDLNQGEIFFDHVRIPRSYMVAGPEAYEAMLEITLSATTCLMGAMGTGIARAAFEESLTYAKEREQGGKPLIEYVHIRMRLFNMLRRVETSRLVSRAAYVYNHSTSTPAEEYSVMAKIHSTQAAFDNTHEAIQIFGGNGLAKEYLIEKLFRDARATLIEDGSNDTLAIAAGHKIIETYPRM